MYSPGNTHLNSEGGSISTADPLVLTGWELAASRKVGILFLFQNSLILTSKAEEVSRTDTFPFFIGESSLVLPISFFSNILRLQHLISLVSVKC